MTLINDMITSLDEAVGSVTGYKLEEFDLSDLTKIINLPPGSQPPVSFPELEEITYPFLEDPTITITF